MSRKSGLKIVSAVLLLALCVMSYGMAPNINKVTLLVVPARYSVLQVAFDIVDQYPTVLVSYQAQQGKDPLLYAWNGAEWVYITLDDYAQARFLTVMPSRVILVGNEELMPEALAQASEWGSMVLNIPSIDTASLINSLATIYGFRQREWRWYAARYNLNLIDLNEELRNDSWYNHPYVEPGKNDDNQYEDRILYQRESYILEESDDGYTLEEDVFVEEEIVATPTTYETRTTVVIDEYVVEADGGKGDLSPPPFMTRVEGWEDEPDDIPEDTYPVK
ncbi:MAG: hypothetical protein EOM20_16255 [Spartobacteria bacterium]|nr:hypothetical protein [Spartobacteria bacterium]